MNGTTEYRRVQRRLFILWAVLIAVSLVAMWPSLRSMFDWGIAAAPRPVTPRGELAPYEKSVVEIFNTASPSVVFINTRTRVANPWTRRVTEVQAGTGSGFVWDDAGHIVTNFHVIRKASSARVVFFDQSSFEASLVGISPDHDLAVLRIVPAPPNLRPIPVGESHNLQVGQSVFAIGNPFGLNHTLTTGVVSALSRQIKGPTERAIEDAIQIDAAINPGNSGGPLLDSAGRLIGVNTAIYSPSGASAGVGFSVPVDTVNRVVPQLIAQGKYRPPRLGIRVNADLSASVTARMGIEGVLILDVEPGSGAEQAGLRGTREDSDGSIVLGDVITRIGDRPIRSMNDLLNALEQYSRGDHVTVAYLRQGESRSAKVWLN